MKEFSYEFSMAQKRRFEEKMKTLVIGLEELGRWLQEIGLTDYLRLDSEKLRILEIWVDLLLFVYGAILTTVTNKDLQQLLFIQLITLFGGVTLGCATGIKNNRQICLHWIFYLAKIGTSITVLVLEFVYLNQGWISRVIFYVIMLVTELFSMFFVMTGKIDASEMENEADASEMENEAGFQETSV